MPGLAWDVVGHDPALYQLFAIQNRSFRIRKINGSRFHVPSDMSRHRLPTALNLGNEDSEVSGDTLSHVW